MALPRDGLGDWADLAFFSHALPDIEAKLATETRAVFPPPDEVFAA